jgi:hypothetical protein
MENAWFLPAVAKELSVALLTDAVMTTSGTMTPRMDSRTHFESVYEKSVTTRISGLVSESFSNTRKKLKDVRINRYNKFKPIKQKEVTHRTPAWEERGSEFLELGYLRPDNILKVS